MTVEQAYQWLFSAAFFLVGIFLLLCLLRTAIGPKITDRVLTVNMSSTLAVALIVWLLVYLQEDWLADVALVYLLLGVVGTALFSKVYTAAEPPEKREREKKKGGDKRHD